MALKIISSLKKEVSIKEIIHKKLAGWEKPRPVDVLHASDLMKELEFCPREYAFLSIGVTKKKDQFIGTSLRITFDHGRDMERRFRNDWLREHMVGWWLCGVCSTTHNHFGKVPKVKCQCGYHRWEYEEPRFASKTSGISGGIDGLVDVGETKLRILEIKSMDKDEHKKLAAPLAEHKFRTALYLKLAEDSELPESTRINTSKANVVYVSKSFGFKDETLKTSGISDSPFSPFKEFVVERDDKLISTPVNKSKAYTHWKVNSDQTGLPCGICHNGLTSRAQKCTAVAVCFSGKYTSRYTWKENGVVRHQAKELID